MNGFIDLYVTPDQLRDYLAKKTATGYSNPSKDTLLLHIPIDHIEHVFHNAVHFKKPINPEAQWS
ncbi:MAG: hypothetical protein V1867_07990 [Candidatus Falkowbacteria bacterium]